MLPAWPCQSQHEGNHTIAVHYGGAPARMADCQWQRLYGQGHPRLRIGDQSRALLHSRLEPGIERHLGELRQDVQARLCSRAPLPDALTAFRQIAGWFEDYNDNLSIVRDFETGLCST
jgi:hypothetical protein